MLLITLSAGLFSMFVYVKNLVVCFQRKTLKYHCSVCLTAGLILTGGSAFELWVRYV